MAREWIVSIVTALLIISGMAVAEGPLPSECDLRVARVVDGDTFYNPTWTWISPSRVVKRDARFRLRRVYAPERGQPGFAEATKTLKDRIEGRMVAVEVATEERDPRGGWIVEVYLCLPDGKTVNVNDEMRAAGWVDKGRGLPAPSKVDGPKK